MWLQGSNRPYFLFTPIHTILQISLASLIVASTQLSPILALNQAQIPTESVQIASGKEIKAESLAELIVAKARAAGVKPNVALAIARCESHLRQFDKDGKVLRGEDNPSDVGIFQINEKFHLTKSEELGLEINTTEGNIDYAMWLLSHQGSGAWHWSKKCWG